MNFFKRTKQVPAIPSVIEVPEQGALPTLDKDLKESLKALSFQSPFRYLLARLAVERAGLRRTLEDGFRLTSDETNFLRAGIYWTGWLKHTLETLTSVPRPSERPATSTEEDLLRKSMESLEIVR